VTPTTTVTHHPIRVRHLSTGQLGTVVGTAGNARYALVRWDYGHTLAEPWAALVEAT
jgi:hypothetical protein